MSLLKHEHTLNPTSFGLRLVEFSVLVEKGRADEVAQRIFEKYENLLKVNIQINSISNVGALAYVNSSEELYKMLEEIKSMQFVNDVEFAEIVKVVGKRPASLFKVQAQN